MEVKKAVETRSKCEAAGIMLLAALMLVLATLACSPGRSRSTAGASPTLQEGSKTCYFGDAVRVGDLVLTLETLGSLESESGDGDGSRSILILYTIENQGFETESITDLLGLVHLEDDAGREYEPQGLSYSLLLPNQTKSGSMAFAVPADAKELVLVIEADENIIGSPERTKNRWDQ